MPQAGVAIGMALVAAAALRRLAAAILSLTSGSTITFELLGPVAMICAARRVGIGRPRGRLIRPQRKRP